MHYPTLPHPDFAGKTGYGDFSDSLAEMDHHVGQILDAIRDLKIEENTIVVFTSDNGPEEMLPYRGWAGPWSGSYFTAMEGSMRVPFIMRWPGRVPAGRVSNEIVHSVDTFTTFAHIAGGAVPKDRMIDGVDQTDFLLGKKEKSNREGFPCYVGDSLHAVKWRNWKLHFVWQEYMWDAPQPLSNPRLFNLIEDPRKFVQRMDIAGNQFGERPYPGTTDRVRGQQCRFGTGLFEIFDDGERLDQRLAGSRDQHRDAHLRVDGAKLRPFSRHPPDVGLVPKC